MKHQKILKIVIILALTLGALAPFVGSKAYADAPADAAKVNTQIQANPITHDIQTIVDVASAGVGLVVVAMIIVGGIQYSVAGDNPQQLTAAKKRITNALIALLVFMFTFAFLQWLIPGGIFG